MSSNPNKIANPAPLGLMGFGMTTILLNLHNAGFIPLTAMILGMGLFYGGIAQVIAGAMAYKNGDTFGTTAFTSYGFFWIVLCFIIMMPKLGLAAATPTGMGWFLTVWGVFSAFLFIGTFKYPMIKRIVFGTLVILFALLAAENFTGNKTFGLIAGFEGIVCGASAIYFAMAIVLNETFEREVMPIG